MAEKKKILLSGIQPSGTLHIGNYFGAMKQFVDLQDKYESYISVVNYHALTSVHDPEVLRKNTKNTVIDHLAIGLDPQKVTLFLQSDIPEITELTWIFNTLITVPYLSRAVAYKEKVERGLEATVGLFDYPVLMAADILIVGAEIVPVGADQKQHVEMARDIATKFNNRYGETFTLPEEKILEDVAVIPGIDGKKMSKSYGNTIPLFASRDEITKQVMGIVTDSGGRDQATKQSIAESRAVVAKVPLATNVFAIHSLFKDEKDLIPFYNANTHNYKALKESLIEDIDSFIAPLREKREKISADEDFIRQILKDGGDKARSVTKKKMEEVRKKIGITF